MNVSERLYQFLLLACFSGWDRDQFDNELRERYPNGPEPHGNGWEDADIEFLWKALNQEPGGW